MAPAAPVAPGAPAAPVKPVAPVSPLSPFAPCAPAWPCAPAAPVAPVLPVSPLSPLSPCGPAGPAAPPAPGLPCGPAGPTGPAAGGFCLAKTSLPAVFEAPDMFPRPNALLLAVVCFLAAAPRGEVLESVTLARPPEDDEPVRSRPTGARPGRSWEPLALLGLARTTVGNDELAGFAPRSPSLRAGPAIAAPPIPSETTRSPSCGTPTLPTAPRTTERNRCRRLKLAMADASARHDGIREASGKKTV
jgi:hypothetical protein